MVVEAKGLDDAALDKELSERGLGMAGSRKQREARLQEALDAELLGEAPAPASRKRKASEDADDQPASKRQELDAGEEGGENKKEEEQGDDDDDDDDDGITFVMRNVDEMEDLLKEGSKEEGEGEDADNDADETEKEHTVKVKFSGQADGESFALLPGKAGLVNEHNYVQYASQLGKRNTPFEVDLDGYPEKPWTRTNTHYNTSLDDYFNYGFNEQTWKRYAARQVALRIYLEEHGKSFLETQKEKAQ